MYCGSKILQCVDWVVLFAEDTFLYSLNLVSISLANFIINDSNYFINKLYLSDSVTTNTSHNLFIAAVVTQFYYLTIYLTPYFDTYFRDLLTSFESNSLYCMHPEILIACKNNDNNFIYYLCEFHMSIYMKYFHETVNTYGVYFAELMVILMVWVFLVLMFYTYYLNPTTNESLIDHDYIASSVTIESEEELGSLDDFLAISMLLISMFFWLFWVNSIIVLFNRVSLNWLFSLTPFLLIFIIFIPTSLLFDFGVYFLAYLSGSGKSNTVVFELSFDYIAVSIFYMRIIIQNVRLIIMMYVFTELHHTLLINKISLKFNFFDEVIVANKGNYWYLLKNAHYYLFVACFVISYWIYELIHTFFMLIFQFIAYIAMIFWLFLFLYSMFPVEMSEAYFFCKREFLKKKKNLIRAFWLL